MEGGRDIINLFRGESNQVLPPTAQESDLPVGLAWLFPSQRGRSVGLASGHCALGYEGCVAHCHDWECQRAVNVPRQTTSTIVT